MRLHPLVLIAVLLTAGLVVAQLPAGAQGPAQMNWEYEADQVITSGGESNTSKIFVSKDRMRLEMASRRGQQGISIVRFDKKLAWVLMPEQKMYMEVPLQDRDALSGRNPNAKVERQLVGQEVVNGHPAKKYRTTVTQEGRTVTGYQWLATTLQDLPIKWQDETGRTSGELRNIKVGRPAAGLFEIPAGYQKFSMPVPGQGGMPPLPRDIPQPN